MCWLNFRVPKFFFFPTPLLAFLKKKKNYFSIVLSICGELLYDWDLSDFSYLVFPLYIGLYFILCHALYSYHSFGSWLDSIISSFAACLDLLQLLSVNTNKIGRGELFVSFWAGELSLFLWCTMFLSLCVCVLHYIHKYLF